MKTMNIVVAACLTLLTAGYASEKQQAKALAEISVSRYRSIQEALNTNPGRMIYVPAGDYTISEK
ncbi:MAG: hypothetical protein WC429_18405, partial [Verrucomicrobiia bacterium]